MIRRFGPFLLLLGILCATCAWAQTDTGTTDTGAPTQPGPKPVYTYPDTTPSLDFLSQSIENSSITLGVSTGFSYDSNGYSYTSTTQSRWLYNLTPRIAIQQFRSRISWHINYSGGLQLYTAQSGSSSYNNLFSQSAGAGFLWQLAPHWQLQGDDNYRHSADPFESYVTHVGTPTLNNPNPVAYSPLTQFTQNTGLLTLTDQLSARDTLAFTGTSSIRHTTTYNLVTSVPFYNLESWGGRGSYSHRLSPRLSLGAGYDFNSLDFGKGQQRSGIQTITMTTEYLIRPNMTISGWIGPEYTGTQDTIFGIKLPHSSQWSTSVGANFGWQGLRNSLRAGFSRQVMDGGGIIATSQVNAFNASYRRMLSLKWDFNVGGRYMHDVSITTTSRNYDNFYVSTGLNYKITKSLITGALYAYVRQTTSNSILLGAGTYTDNRVAFSITYNWNHPLGR